MKYLELKKSLENIDNVYIIFGEDRYLCQSALAQIEQALNITLPDFNSISMSTTSAEEIIAACNVYPYVDKFRYVKVTDFYKNNVSDQNRLITYMQAPNKSCVLVMYCVGESQPKNLPSGVTLVDCNKLDSVSIREFIKAKMNASGTKIDQGAINLLILFCLSDMQKINSEIDKLLAYSYDTKVITEADVQNLVTQDKEYQIYYLADLICSGKSADALDLVDNLSKTNSMGILGALYNNYRRALYLAITPQPDSTIAKQLNIKEFAIKYLRNQTKVFSPRKLKQIVDYLKDADTNIKQGKTYEDIACKNAVIHILKIRNS